MIKIDKNIPMPNVHLENKLKYPFGKMKVGDSFLFSTYYTRKKMKEGNWIHRNYGRKFKQKFTMAKWKKGIRIWRVK